MLRRVQVLLVAPYPLGQPRGNSVTIERIARGLRQQGARVTLLSPTQPVPRRRFDLVHAFHAYRAGPRGLTLAQQWNAALVVTLTGTDFNHDLRLPARRSVVRRVLEQVDALIVFDAQAQQRLRERVAGVAGRVRVIPQAVDPCFLSRWGKAKRDSLRRQWRRRLQLKESDFVFLYPSGIRAVKDPFFLLRAFPRLRRKHPQARLLFAGPVLERDYGRRFLAQARKVPGVTYRAAVAPGAMPSLYAAADAVVNSSRSEGMSNSLLEAMGMSVPVLVRAIDANRNLVREGRTGLLFRNIKEFARQAERLLVDAALRRKLTARARSLVRLRHDPRAEATAHLRLYRRLLKEQPRA